MGIKCGMCPAFIDKNCVGSGAHVGEFIGLAAVLTALAAASAALLGHLP
jgi:hypothetical protein